MYFCSSTLSQTSLKKFPSDTPSHDGKSQNILNKFHLNVSQKYAPNYVIRIQSKIESNTGNKFCNLQAKLRLVTPNFIMPLIDHVTVGEEDD